MPHRVAAFTVGFLLPQPLARVEDEPDEIQREVKGGRRGVTGAVDGLRVLVAAEHLGRLILHAFAMNFDDRVGAMHVDAVPKKPRVESPPQARGELRTPALC